MGRAIGPPLDPGRNGADPQELALVRCVQPQIAANDGAVELGSGLAHDRHVRGSDRHRADTSPAEASTCGDRRIRPRSEPVDDMRTRAACEKARDRATEPGSLEDARYPPDRAHWRGDPMEGCEPGLGGARSIGDAEDMRCESSSMRRLRVSDGVIADAVDRFDRIAPGNQHQQPARVVTFHRPSDRQGEPTLPKPHRGPSRASRTQPSIAAVTRMRVGRSHAGPLDRRRPGHQNAGTERAAAV